MRYRTFSWMAVGALFILFFVIIPLSAGIYTDWLWFDSLGFASVYWTIWGAKAGIVLVFALLFFLIFYGVLQAARYLCLREPAFHDYGGLDITGLRFVKWGLAAVALFLSLIMGAAALGHWEEILLYLNRQPFGLQDPIFSRDLSFFVFALPPNRFLQSWLIQSLVLALLGSLAIFALFQAQDIVRFGRFYLNPYMKVHLSIVGALILALIGWGYRLSAYELVYSTQGVVFGAGYTDIHARLLAYRMLFWIANLCAVLLLVNIFIRGLWLPAIGAGLWLVAAFLTSGIFPTLMQSFTVKPMELEKERPYIERNIKYTRYAYNLDKIEEQDYTVAHKLSAESLAQEGPTLRNIRLWDYRPLKETYGQIQEIRLYYDFADIDIDRYIIAGERRQVMLAAREIATEQLPSRNWINDHLAYTHGYGMVMNPVNEVTGEGLPVLYIKDIPPKSTVGLEITRPEIYFGEKTNTYVFVKTGLAEFDYPKGDENVTTIYQGEGGVALSSPFRRLMFAYRLGDMNLVLSRYINSQSQVMIYRNIHERVRKVAPFLRYDKDPYIVIAEGKLYWIQDAYTHTKRYPYSQPYDGRFNYIRNSVKVVIDAYDGQTKFYIADPSDPLIQAYASLFPALFQPLAEMPASLRAHIRYPEDLFAIQAALYSIYHMRDPTVFYNREDKWAIPNEIFAGTSQPIEPYYVIMKLLGEEKEEFLLMQPFTPAKKDNMIAWMAARSDGEAYGKLVVYKFPKQELVYGPLQIQARIDQEPSISAQLTLWSQRGSRVVRGNLLVIPIGHSLIYVEPLYLQAETGQLPQLKRVTAASGERVVMEENLERALQALFGEAPATKPAIAPGKPAAERDTAELAASAQAHYSRALEYLRAGNWAKYGEELEALGQDLKALAEKAGAK